jgi:hypothetical protein
VERHTAVVHLAERSLAPAAQAFVDLLLARGDGSNAVKS